MKIKIIGWIFLLTMLGVLAYSIIDIGTELINKRTEVFNELN